MNLARRTRHAVLLVASLLLGLVAAPAHPASAGAPPTFEVRGSIGQVATWGHVPGTEVELIAPGGDVLDGASADAQGAVLFRGPEVGVGLDAGDGYEVRADGVTSDPLTVTDPEVHPGAEAYEDIPLSEGYGYMPTRDGTLLSVNVGFPLDGSEGPWPVLVNYSGYSPADPGGLPPEVVAYLFLGYVVVGVNMRGTGCSGGAFDFFEEPQLTDGYDVIETVARQSWSNGNVGMAGISYGGISQLQVASTRPPSLDAITPLSPYADTYRGILYPGGIRNEGFALGWAQERQEEAQPLAAGWARKRVAEGDTVCADNQVLRLQSRDLDNEIRPGRFDQPNLAYLDLTNKAARVEVPTYLAAQYQDEQTGGSAVALVDALQDGDAPFRAAFTNGIHTEPMGPTELPRAAEFLEFYVHQRVPDIEPLNPLLEAALQGIFGVPVEAPPNRFDPSRPYEEQLALYEAEQPVRIRYENGGVEGKEGHPYPTVESTYDSWPIPGTTAERWYLQPRGGLATTPPTATDGRPGDASSYHYDPDLGRRTSFDGGTSGTWTAHPDIHWESPPAGTALTFTTARATTKTVYTGTASADLWMRSDATDADLEVVLTEVRPDGQEVYIQSGWMRASHRQLDPAKSTELAPYATHLEEDAAPLGTDGWTPVRVPIFPFSHIVRPGSQLRVSIEAPGGNQAFWAFSSLQDDATNRIAHSADFPSSVALPRISDPGVVAGSPEVAPSCSVDGVTTQAQSLRGQPCRVDEVAGRATRFVDQAWDDFLGRAPTAEERASTTDDLVTGVTGRRGVVSGLATSPEWAGAIVEQLYLTTLERPGDAPGVAYWADRIRSGQMSVARVAARFLASAEYLGRFGGDLGAWVDDLYVEILGRPSDAPGRAHWLAVADTKGPTRVALSIYQSAESSRTRVRRLYLTLLGRDADPDGLAFWAPRVLRSGDITLAIDLASSAEYLARAQG